jgi:hypothetical protein
VAACRRDGRLFVVTQSHLLGELRSFESRPLVEEPVLLPLMCDFCDSRDRGAPMATVVDAGLRQGTCPACHRETVSGHDTDTGW